MHALADCIKALQGMTSSARNSQAAQDLHRIIEAKKAHVQAHPERLADVTTSSTTPNLQQVPRVQTPNISRVPRVQVPPNVPATNNTDNRRITHSMLAQPSIPRVHKPIRQRTCPPNQLNEKTFGSGESYDYAMPPHQLAHLLEHEPELRWQRQQHKLPLPP